jgi:hypothetical protein
MYANEKKILSQKWRISQYFFAIRAKWFFDAGHCQRVISSTEKR